MLAGIVLQAVGIFLLSTVPTDTDFWTGQIGYTVVAGMGVGMAAAAVYMMVPLTVQEEDQSIALGTGLQLRMLGSALGIAIATTILHSHLKAELGGLLAEAQLDGVLESTRNINDLSSVAQVQIRRAFGEAYNLQMKAAGGFSIAQLLSVLLMWKKEQVRFVKTT